MEFNRPLTAKEAALQDAQSTKPPFHREADKRRVIASAIRRIGLTTGQTEETEEPAEADDEMRESPIVADDAEPQTMLGGPGGQPAAADWDTIDSRRPADLSLADMIVADQAASRGLAQPPAALNAADTVRALGSSIDALQSPRWIAAAFERQALRSRSLPEFSALDQFIDRHNPLEFAPDKTPREIGWFENSQFDASPPGMRWPLEIDDWFHHDATDPISIVQLPYHHGADSPDPKIQLLAGRNALPERSPSGDGDAPITYLPFDQPSPASSGDSAPREQLRVEIESGFADLSKDATVAFLAMEPAILKAIERAGEQDRRDAFMREASRRACL